MKSVNFLYGTSFGRFLLKVMMGLHLDRLVVFFLNSRLSCFMISSNARKNGIRLNKEEKKFYPSFGAFFRRKMQINPIDMEQFDLIAPCNGYFSWYCIDEDNVFHIKGSHYTVIDFVGMKAFWREGIGNRFRGGYALIFRLEPVHYHHFICIDNGYVGKNHFIEGELHSVQPIATEKYPVYTLNRRMWTRYTTKNFGTVIQCEIGAFIVGGICCEKENCRVWRGEDMGHFELSGSTIVLLFEKNKIRLGKKMMALKNGEEVEVHLGECIGNRLESILD